MYVTSTLLTHHSTKEIPKLSILLRHLRMPSIHLLEASRPISLIGPLCDDCDMTIVHLAPIVEVVGREGDVGYGET